MKTKRKNKRLVRILYLSFIDELDQYGDQFEETKAADGAKQEYPKSGIQVEISMAGTTQKPSTTMVDASITVKTGTPVVISK